jgi:hypothetical protein
MKNLLPFFSFIVCIGVFFYPATSHSNSSGSVGGKTGSPADVGSCTQCHYAGLSSSTTITSNIPSIGYVPGTIYTISTNINQLGINKFGFEFTAEEDAGSTKAGVFIVTNNTETQLTNNNTAVTHTLSGTSGTNSKSWTMDWQAPISGTGNITFYAVYIAANGNGNNNGDTYHSALLSVSEAQSSCILTGGSVYIDNSSSPWMMNATVNGISQYSYAWTDTNGILVGSANQIPFYTQWCVTITDNNTGCDTTICQDCIANTSALCACPMIYMPVCGCDGVMYSNYCIADCADIPWTPAVSNGMPGGFLPCSSWVPNTHSSCGVEISGDSIICNLNNPQILTASPNAATTIPVTYQWYGNGMSSNSNILTINAPGTYCVTQIDANGCIDSACITVILQDIPIYTVSSQPIICLGDSIVLEIDTLGLSNIIWVPNSLLTPPVHRIIDFPTFSQTYVVQAIDSVGCDRRGEVFVSVYPLPPLNPMTIPNPPIICLGDSIIIEVNQGFVGYWWNTGNSNDIDKDRVVVYPTQDFIYFVEALDTNGCESKEEIEVFVDSCTTSFFDINQNYIQIFPNPASEEFFINMTHPAFYNIQIFDIVGKLIMRKENLNNLTTINTTKFSKGTYFIRIQNPSDIKSYKVVIDR